MRLLFLLVASLVCSHLVAQNARPVAMPAPSLTQNKAGDILKLACERVKAHKDISYHASCRSKNYTKLDTVTLSGNVYLSRDEADTFFRAKIWFSTPSGYVFYDGHKIYQVGTVGQDKGALSFDPLKGQAFILPLIQGYAMVCDEFLHPDDWVKTFAANKLTLLADTTINNQACWVIVEQYPDNGEYIHSQSLLYIAHSDYALLLQKNSNEFQGNYMYTELYMDSCSYRSVPASRFAAAQIPPDYKIKAFNTEDAGPPPFLAMESPAPLLAGRLYRPGSTAQIAHMPTDTLRYNGKMTLLDFWYMGCVPCREAIPNIEHIKEKYKSKGLQVYGVNINETDEKSLSLIPKFMGHNKMDYPVFFVADGIRAAYQVFACPTFYLIDDQGKVFYASTIHGAALEQELSQALDKRLK